MNQFYFVYLTPFKFFFFISCLFLYRCDIIAIGNGTACRETESVVADLLKQGVFKPLPVVYRSGFSLKCLDNHEIYIWKLN